MWKNDAITKTIVMLPPEGVFQIFNKKGFLEISQNSQEKPVPESLF